MLKRLKVKNFKNLVDLDVRFGPFTCIAGENGSGKSNLFDAIKFLGALAEKPLRDAALSIRNEGGRAGDSRSLFHRSGDRYADEMSFEAEIELPPAGVDDFGRPFTPSETSVRYSLTIRYSDHRLGVIAEEILNLPSNTPFDWQADRPGAPTPSAWLSIVNAPLASMLRNEMRSWRCLQLEPSALRQPDDFPSDDKVGVDGAHLPATLDRLSKTQDVFPRLTGRLAELIPEIRDMRVDRDIGRQRLTLQLLDKYGTWHDARALSDGTLRFLALAAIEWDPEAVGVICLEEPENGIHPARIPSMVRLLRNIAFDPEFPIGEDNPLRQVIINTHSPTVAAVVPENSLLFARAVYGKLELRCLPNTWRAAVAGRNTIRLGELLSYLEPFREGDEDRKDRVIDRADVIREVGQPT